MLESRFIIMDSYCLKFSVIVKRIGRNFLHRVPSANEPRLPRSSVRTPKHDLLKRSSCGICKHCGAPSSRLFVGSESVRYQRDFRDNVEKMRGVLIGSQSGAQIPLGQMARISFMQGPAMIRDEDGGLKGYIYIDLKNTDYGGFVRNADKPLHNKIVLPANYSFQWSGEYELELRAKERLQLILPVVFFVISSCCIWYFIRLLRHLYSSSRRSTR